jgi:hypothetical protein
MEKAEKYTGKRDIDFFIYMCDGLTFCVSPLNFGARWFLIVTIDAILILNDFYSNSKK